MSHFVSLYNKSIIFFLKISKHRAFSGTNSSCNTNCLHFSYSLLLRFHLIIIGTNYFLSQSYSRHSSASTLPRTSYSPDAYLLPAPLPDWLHPSFPLPEFLILEGFHLSRSRSAIHRGPEAPVWISVSHPKDVYTHDSWQF